MKKTLIIVVVLIALAAGWYLGAPLVFDKAVDEAFPYAAVTEEERKIMQEAVADMDVHMPPLEEMRTMTEVEVGAMERQMVAASAAQPDTATEELMPAAPVLERSGVFRDADDFHKGSGEARIYTLPNGERVLRLEDFRVTNGPDLRVLLAAQPPPEESDALGAYVELAKLKGNVGNQNYAIPDDVDLSAYQRVVIYCKPFHVVFAMAELE